MSTWTPVEDSDGDVFYVNEETGESRWTKPGWIAMQDSDGDEFFYNEATGETAWEKPDDASDAGAGEADGADVNVQVVGEDGDADTGVPDTMHDEVAPANGAEKADVVSSDTDVADAKATEEKAPADGGSASNDEDDGDDGDDGGGIEPAVQDAATDNTSGADANDRAASRASAPSEAEEVDRTLSSGDKSDERGRNKRTAARHHTFEPSPSPPPPVAQPAAPAPVVEAPAPPADAVDTTAAASSAQPPGSTTPRRARRRSYHMVESGRVTAALRKTFLSHDRLLEVPLLAACTADETAVISMLFTSFTVPSGAEIFAPGDIAKHMFIVAKGCVKVQASGGEAELAPHQVFGDTALLLPEVRRHFSATAVGDVTLLGLTHEVLGEAMGLDWFQENLRDLLDDDFTYIKPFLDEVPFFREAPDTLLAELGGICTIMLAPPAQVLVREGHPGEALFMVLSGDVRVTARGKRLATLGAGSYFGEIALLKSVNTTASVAAVEGCLLLVLHRPQFEQLLHKVPVLRTALEAYVTARTGNRIASLNVPLFAGISEAALIRLSEVAQFKRFEEGEVLFHEGAEGHQQCYVVTQGVLNVSRHNIDGAQQVGAGGFVGAEALVARKPRPCTAEAAMAVSVLEFNRHDVMHMFSNDMAALGRFELRLLRQDAKLEHVLRVVAGYEAFADFAAARVDSDVLQFLLHADNFKRHRERQSALDPDSVELALIVLRLCHDLDHSESADPSREPQMPAILEEVDFQRVREEIEAARHLDEADLAHTSLLPANVFAKIVALIHQLVIGSHFDTFKQSTAFRRLLREVGTVDDERATPAGDARRFGEFKVDKINRFGTWQSRLLTFEVDNPALLFMDRSKVVLHRFTLLGMASVQRLSNKTDQIVIAFRDSSVRPVHLRFKEAEEREQFCMLASILEPDIIFTNDCETRKDDDEMLYNVSMVSKRVKRRRVLSVNAATRELKRINPARDTSKTYPLDRSLSIETSRVDPCRCTVVHTQQGDAAGNGASVDRVEYVFPTAPARQRFSGRVRAICAGMNLAEVRVLGMQQAGFKGRDLTVFTGSWNVAETTPPADPTTLAEWLRPGEYDVYAITLQECDHKDEWAAAIASLLDPTSTPAVKKKKNVFKRVGKLLKLRKKKKKPSTGGRRASVVKRTSSAQLMQVFQSLTLDDVCADHDTTEKFGNYLNSVGELELLDFTMAAQRHIEAVNTGSLAPEAEAAEGAQLFDTFLAPNGPETLQVRPGVRARAASRLAAKEDAASVYQEALDIAKARLDVHLVAWQKQLERTPLDGEFVVKVGEYAHVTTVSLWGIHLIIYARCEVANEITHLQTSTVATGLANVMGNKGGAAASFVYRDATSFAFVGCHLAARASRLRERGEDYMNICKGLHLGSKGLQFLHQFHHVFWMGDLNYRINNGDETPEEFARVIQCIESRQLWRLRQQDQLANEMRTKPIFAGFKEGRLNFRPTYRMLKGQPDYSNKKNQNPSWCDRVLWRSHAGYRGRVRQLAYEAVHEIDQSDHRPVWAGFEVKTMLPYLNISNTVANYGQCHISIPFLQFTADEAALSVTHVASRGAQGGTAPQADPQASAGSNPSAGAGGAGAGAGAAAAAAQGTDGNAAAEEEVAIKAGDVNVSIQANFLEKTASSLYSHFDGHTVTWSEQQIPLAIPFIGESGWIMWQHVILTLRHKNGALIGCAELPLADAKDYRPLPAEAMSMHKVLQTPALLEQFERHLAAEFKIENLEFYRAVEAYRKHCFAQLHGDESMSPIAIARRRPSVVNAEMLARAKQIMDTYIGASAPCLVQLPKAIRASLKDQFRTNEVGATTFDDAQAEVFHDMATTSFISFRTEYGKKQADVLRRGGGAPFTVDVLRDGRRVGHITGQAALHSFDDLREKQERIAAMTKLMNRRREQAQIDRKLMGSLDSDVEGDGMPDGVTDLLELARKAGSAVAGATVEAGARMEIDEDTDAEYRAELSKLVRAALEREETGHAKGLQVLLGLAFERMEAAEQKLVDIVDDDKLE